MFVFFVFLFANFVFQFELQLLNLVLVELGDFFSCSLKAVFFCLADHLFQHFLFLFQFYFGLLALHQNVVGKVECVVFELEILPQLLDYFVSFLNLFLHQLFLFGQLKL